MAGLKDILNSEGFKLGIELVSTRGTFDENKTRKVLEFGEELGKVDEIDWISITDNAGGHPAISSNALASVLKGNGKEIIIHLTCKDYNRNGLESKAWELSSEGLNNILAITGDLPQKGVKGYSKPVFDLDSVSLLQLLKTMNEGLETGIKKKTRLRNTNFYTGAVISNFKMNENELMPQYLKLLKKIESGASFIINQAGYDAVKMSELKSFLEYRNLDSVHLIGNVFVLSRFTMNLFHQKRIPGVVLPNALYEQARKAVALPDKGKSFFLELAAKMLAIYKGLGYKAGYLGGVHNIKDYNRIMDLFNCYTPDNWKDFYKELSFIEEDDFFMFERNAVTGITDPKKINPKLSVKGPKTSNVNFKFRMSKKFHELMFTRDKGFYNTGKKICKTKQTAPGWMFGIEKMSKRMLYDCRDCGDCSLDEIEFLCPESQCAKNQRNGPCGGSTDSVCESEDMNCIWTRAYERKKYDGDVWTLLDHVPVIQDHQLRGTSGWANYWLEKDHKSNK